LAIRVPKTQQQIKIENLLLLLKVIANRVVRMTILFQWKKTPRVNLRTLFSSLVE
jgi:hypothetical protein